MTVCYKFISSFPEIDCIPSLVLSNDLVKSFVIHIGRKKCPLGRLHFSQMLIRKTDGNDSQQEASV
jgi:hypothetical protein